MLAAPSFPPLLFVPPRPLVLLAALVLGGLALACTTFRGPLAVAAGMTEPAFVKQLLEFGSIPLTSLIVTYLHIWLALHLTFYPAAYVGCLQLPGTNLGLGWQAPSLVLRPQPFSASVSPAVSKAVGSIGR